jgi:hypothetical protein
LKKIGLLESELPDSIKEQTVIDILKIKARFRSIPPDVVHDSKLSP